MSKQLLLALLCATAYLQAEQIDTPPLPEDLPAEQVDTPPLPEDLSMYLEYQKCLNRFSILHHEFQQRITEEERSAIDLNILDYVSTFILRECSKKGLQALSTERLEQAHELYRKIKDTPLEEEAIPTPEINVLNMREVGDPEKRKKALNEYKAQTTKRSKELRTETPNMEDVEQATDSE